MSIYILHFPQPPGGKWKIDARKNDGNWKGGDERKKLKTVENVEKTSENRERYRNIGGKLEKIGMTKRK